MTFTLDEQRIDAALRATENITSWRTNRRCYVEMAVMAYLNFKVSDTPPSGPEGISGHTVKAAPHEHKEIA